MSVYTKRFLGPQTLTSTSTVYATVPAGKVWVIRDLEYAPLTATRLLTILITRAAAQRTWVNVSVLLETTWHLTTRQVLAAGDQISANATPNGGSLTISGYEFSA